MKLIDKDALVVEIEKFKAEALQKKSQCKRHGLEKIMHQISAYNKVLSFINTLEVKEVDLEEKATQLSQKYFPDEENIWARPNIEAQRCKSACIEMVEWLKAQKGEEV